MSNKNTSTGGSTNTAKGPVVQDGENLNIPRLGAGAPPAASGIVQDGEGGGTNTQQNTSGTAQLDQAATLGQNIGTVDNAPVNEATQRPPAVENPPAAAPRGPASGSIGEMVAQARHNPVRIDSYDEMPMHANVREQTVNIPITGRLDHWEGRKQNRPDLVIESHEGLDMDHAAHLAFLEEFVIVNVAESTDPVAENPVMLAINGRSVFLTRGMDQLVKRKYVEQLLRAKPVGIKVTVGRDQNGEIVNKTTKSTAMKYPFSMVRDDNPLGRPWMRKILSEG